MLANKEGKKCWTIDMEQECSVLDKHSTDRFKDLCPHITGTRLI
jgi:hypothetical protein